MENIKCIVKRSKKAAVKKEGEKREDRTTAM
jgi:hypothetical protein